MLKGSRVPGRQSRAIYHGRRCLSVLGDVDWLTLAIDAIKSFKDSDSDVPVAADSVDVSTDLISTVSSSTSSPGIDSSCRLVITALDLAAVKQQHEKMEDSKKWKLTMNTVVEDKMLEFADEHLYWMAEIAQYHRQPLRICQTSSHTSSTPSKYRMLRNALKVER
ncbi:hypothetical protein VTP01DRAFT_5846 [Rhizomucor pusillus]|uniref:uncharacterized protein n=1 Tax=Rhizomucor pusillus TaxID=4840 RepID=UPI0037449C70